MRTNPEPAPLIWGDEPSQAWEPYAPEQDGAWNLSRSAHLHRRAGFGATPARLAQDVAAGWETSIQHLLDGDPACSDGRSRREFDEIYAAMTDSFKRDPTMGRVRSMSLFRLIHSPHPLQERITLAWSNHYATGARKVLDPMAMLDQHEAIRTLWDQTISKLHDAMIHSSAMQRWLDGIDSAKESPNENLSREFLELFALGEGAYSESDVKAAARALTGFRAVSQVELGSLLSVFDPNRHDDGEKTLLGQTGRWGPADVVRIASNHPAAARLIAKRLYRTFIDDFAPPPALLLDALADRIRTPGDVDVRKGIEVVLKSRLFHSQRIRGRKVKSPIDFVVGLIRTLGWHRPSPDSSVLDNSLARMGQILFEPPNVAGWPGGMAWLDAPLLIARANFVATIASGPTAEKRLNALAERQNAETPDDWMEILAPALLTEAPAGHRRRLESASTYSDVLKQIGSFPEAHLA